MSGPRDFRYVLMASHFFFTSHIFITKFVTRDNRLLSPPYFWHIMSQEENTVVTLEPSSLNSNQVPLNGNYRHLENDQSTQEKADVLFKKNDPYGSEILAPMVRASTTPLRTLALSYGCDIVYTEEIIDRAITSTERCYNEHLKTIDYKKKMENFTAKVQKRLKKYDEESPKAFLRISPDIERNKLVYQMGTGEPELALPAAMMVQNDVDCLDINMVCILFQLDSSTVSA